MVTEITWASRQQHQTALSKSQSYKINVFLKKTKLALNSSIEHCLNIDLTMKLSWSNLKDHIVKEFKTNLVINLFYGIVSRQLYWGCRRRWRSRENASFLVGIPFSSLKQVKMYIKRWKPIVNGITLRDTRSYKWILAAS